MTDQKRLKFGTIFISLGFLSSLLISFPLWTANRLFPTTPFLFSLNQDLSLVLFFLLTISTLLLVFSSSISSILIICSYFIFVMSDLNRIQPWCYQYTLMSAAFFIRKNDSEILHTWRIILAAIYLWSGLHKFNLAFPLIVMPWMANNLLGIYPKSINLIITLGFLAPVIESLIGIGLIFQKTRKLSTISAIFMHLMILISIGPLGHNWNKVVWPWNITMISLLILLFNNTSNIDANSILNFKNLKLKFFIFIVVAILPILSLIRLWPDYYSWALYSYDTHMAEVRFSEDPSALLPETIAKMIKEINMDDKKFYQLKLDDWSVSTQSVPVSPQYTVFSSAKNYLCNLLNNSNDLKFHILSFPNRYSLNKNDIVWTCQ